MPSSITSAGLPLEGGAMTGAEPSITFPTANVPAAKYRLGIYPAAQTGTNDIIWLGYNLSETTFTANTASDAMNWIGLESEYNDGLGHANTMEMYGRFMAAGQSGNNFISAWFANYDKDANKVLTFDIRSEHTRLLDSANTVTYLDITPSGGSIGGAKFGVNLAVGPTNPGDLLHLSAVGGGGIRIQDTTASTGGDCRIVQALHQTTFNEYDVNHSFIGTPLTFDQSTVRVPQGSALTAGTLTYTTNSAVRNTIHRFDWTNAMVTALGATTTGNVAVCTLPAKVAVRNAYVVITTAAGTVTTLTVSLGRTSAAYTDYIVASDAKAATNTVYGNDTAERGTNLTGYDLPAFAATTVVNLQFISTGGNLSTVTASTGTVYLETVTLP